MSDLDPRGLAAALRAVEGQGLTSDGGTPHGWRCEHPDRYPDYCKCPTEMAESAVTAYLAVTQPIVDDVQALKDLPVGVVVRSAAGTIACRVDESNGIVVRSAAGTIGWTSLMLPARVIWSPHEGA